MSSEAARPLLRRVADAPDRWVVVLLVAVSYLPILLTDIGRVSADTKTYLTLDPATVVRTAPTMWDPTVGAGTVPHQNIGYLFPLGPYYWALELLAVPDWITQRLLWGTLVFAAAYGTYRLLRWLGWDVTAALVAALAYGLSPYLLSYLARLSAILGPWAAMPWMILLAAKAARTRSWRPAAWFAVVIALVGSVNATALVFAGLGPVLWLIADTVAGRVRARGAVAGALRIGLLSMLVSAWWIVGLRAQGTYGIPILRYTESYRAVAGASTPAEVLRGLGYWFFYGGDGLDPWVGPSTPYFDDAALMTLGFVVAGISLLGFLVPFAGRAVATLFLVVGLAVSVGAAPIGDSTLYGSWFESFADDTTVGLALRSTTRAAPLVVLALAMGIGSAADAARRWLAGRAARRPSLAWLAPSLVVLLIVLQLSPWFTGSVLTPSIQRDEQLPAYETELADWLDRSGDGRVYEIPGADFANYRWGGTVDPVLPGIIERPYLARELVPQGGAATADLLNGFERRLSDGWFEPESLAPVAQLFDVGTVVTRNDLEHERYGLARPGPLWTDVTSALGRPDHAGPSITDQTAIPLVDSLSLSRPDAADEFPAVAGFDIGLAPVVTALPVEDPIVVVGSGDGLVDLASAGLLPTGRAIAYAATLDELARSGELSSEQADAVSGTDAWWVVTDTNRRQGRHWSTIGSNLGAIESATPLTLEEDPGDNRLDLFDDRIENQTVAVHRAGIADVRASDYGNQIAYTPEDSPWFAIDSDPSTAWRAGVFAPVDGIVWEADLRGTATTGQITLLQPVTGAVDRYITRARVTVGGESVEVDLDERSRTVPGQVVDLPVGAFDAIRIEVLEDNLGERSSYAALPGVGFAEVAIPGVVDDRVVRVPSVSDNAVFDAAAPPDRLTYLFTRERISAATPNRTSPEPRLVREFDVPDRRSFELTGEVRLSPSAGDATLQQALQEMPSVLADRRLHGVADARGAAALDGDLSTAWTTPLDEALGATLTISAPLETAELSITWLDDDEHSVPARFTLRGDGGESLTLDVADAGELARSDGLATATFGLGGYSAETSILTVDAIAARTAPEYFSRLPQVLPVAIAEIDPGPIDADAIVRGPATVDTGCRTDLIEVDGEPLEVRIVGERAAARSGGELQLLPCGGPLELDAGTHRIDAAGGSVTGFDVDRLVLDADGTGPSSAPRPPPLTVERRSETALDVGVPPTSSPFWLTLNESWNPGWTATIDGVDLGEPLLVGGYKNGWLVPAEAAERVVELRWTPQRVVRLGLAVSAFGVVSVLVLLVVTWPRRGASRRTTEPSGDASAAPLWSRRSIAAAGLLALVFLLVGGLVAALAVAVTLLVTTRWRWWPAAVVLGLGAVVGGAIVALEWRRDYAAGPDWPTQFGWTAPVVWVVVAVVATAAVFPYGAGRRTGPPTTGEEPDEADGGR